ncbi:FecR family protein [Chitinophaga arvensicola]|uniref:FecR protein n=1 Tax=Chitinophaga arvensicola TaxID=29529 RepID=A0A1I0R3V0_9BACT|nr:FecR family protein [Chitinophaga arvensicola]SEW35067.1 FecR protein [Chitinophaga arvensicola]
MKHEQLTYLIDRFVNKTITPEEKAALLELLQTEDETTLAETGVDAWLQENLPVMEIREDDPVVRQHLAAILSADKITGSGNTQQQVVSIHAKRRWYWAAAAAAALLITAGTYTFIKNHPATRSNGLAQSATPKLDMPPGQQGAILTLADGSQLVLDTVKHGEIASQNGTKLTLKKGELSYDASNAAQGSVVYNTVNTPNGRQFQLTLPDGTKVWMNAGSSIRYPNYFYDHQRKVSVTGEVYFEVAQQAEMPFIVDVDHRAEVEVLGTHFDVNAYGSGSQQIKTTLLEGAVRVSKGAQKATLRPGQQAQVGASINVINNVNINQVVAWKNGFFNFENMRLEEVMQQLERWYNIEVVYEGAIPDVSFYGELRRDLNLSGIIAALSDSGVHFRVEGNKLIVLP